MAYDQAADLRQQRLDEHFARSGEAKELRRDAMQRSPTLKPMNQRSSTLSRIPFIGFIFQFIAGLITSIGVRNIARRQRPLTRLPRIPGAKVPLKVSRGRFAGRKFPGWPGKMGRGAFRGPSPTTFGPQRNEPFGPRHPEIHRRPAHLRTPQKPHVLSKRRRAA